MANKSWKDQSRINWEPAGTRQITTEEIQVGALQRIADATEVMAKNHQNLIDERDRYKRRYEYEQKENQRMARRIAALQGVITKLKKAALPILLLIFFASCAPSRITPCPNYVGLIFNADTLLPCQHKLPNCKCLRVAAHKYDTTSEWMHISMTRGKGFVIAYKALAIRKDGYCVQHLDCAGKPLPLHYRVGWCEGKELLFNRLVSQLK
jgi:hypothetical protein